MKKRLLLTLLPLAFFVAACGGNNTPAASSSHATGLSTTSQPTSSAQPTSAPAGDESTSEPDPEPAEVIVPFSVEYDTGDGKGVYAVGSFSDWAPAAEYRLDWSDGNIWIGTLTLTEGDTFKLAIAEYENPTEPSAWEWGDDETHVRTVTTGYTVTGWEVETPDPVDPPEPGEGVTVSFNVNYDTGIGSSVYVVGDFCDWAVSADYVLTWSEGNNWVGEIELPDGAEFKLAIAATENPTTVTRWEWQGSEHANRVASEGLTVSGWEVE